MTLLDKPAAKWVFTVLLAALCVVETLCYTYFKNNAGLGIWNNVIYMACGVLMCCITALFAFGNTAQPPTRVRIMPLAIKAVPAIGFIVLVSSIYMGFGNHLFPLRPVNYKEADMLPLIKAGSERLLKGEDVYAPVPEIWKGEQMPYLPAMWLPFVPATALHADIRWTTITATVLCAFILLLYAVHLRTPNFVIAALVFFTCLYLQALFYTCETQEYFALSEEAVPAFFYVLLVLGLMLRNDWLTGIALALCTLSRYTLLPFIPFFFLWLVIDKNYRSLWRIAGIYIFIIAFLFLTPFFSKRPMYFLSPPPGYIAGETTFWNLDLATVKTNLGIGFMLPENSPVLPWLRKLMLGLPALWSAIWLFIYRRNRSRLSANKWLWVITGLKGALLLFYCFLAQPYPYLFIVPTIISYPLLLAVLWQVNFKADKTVAYSNSMR